MKMTEDYFSKIMYTIHDKEIENLEGIEKKVFPELSDLQHEYLLALKINFFIAGFECGKTNKNINSLFKKFENYDKI